METHPAAEIFPLMSAAEYRALVEDIRQHGQREPIVLYDGRILDGRNRWRACQELGVEPRFIDWNEDDGVPSVFVVSRNLHRRHLNEAQRAEIAARLATRKPGRPQRVKEKVAIATFSPTVREAAALMNIDRASVHRAKQRLAGATDERAARLTEKAKKKEGQPRTTTIVMKPNQAARVLCERWPLRGGRLLRCFGDSAGMRPGSDCTPQRPSDAISRGTAIAGRQAFQAESSVGVETRTERQQAFRCNGEPAAREPRVKAARGRRLGGRPSTDSLCREAGAIQQPRGENARPVLSAGFHPPGATAAPWQRLWKAKPRD